MRFYEIIILILIIWLCLYCTVVRICECMEKCGLYNAIAHFYAAEKDEIGDIGGLAAMASMAKELNNINGRKDFTSRNKKTTES